MMKKVKFIEFHVKHLEILEMREEEKNGIFTLNDIYERIERLAENSILAFTMIYDGRIITCAGFVELWPGVAEIWQIPSKYVAQNPVLFARDIRRFLEEIINTFKWHRVETKCPVDDLHDRWMKWLGFECEGHLKKFSHDKKDVKQYARLIEWQ